MNSSEKEALSISTETSVKEKEQATKTTCYHCGEDCKDETIVHDDHSFCCTGCKMVYQVLSGAGLHDYYELEEKPGQRMDGKGSTQRFAYLDDAEIQRQLLDFSDGRVAKVTFYVPQIHCTSCIWLLEKLHQLETGVLSSKVNFLKKEVYMTFDQEELSLKEVVQLLSRIGYEPSIQFDSLDKKQKSRQRKKSKEYIYQIGVTGFCLGNIMLASFPEYLGITRSDQDFIDLFGYLNTVLALPVLFFGAKGYLRSAWEALRHRGVNIDVPISLGILVLFTRSFYEILSQTGAGYLDSMASLVFLLLVGKWFQQKTFDNISFERDYKSYFPIAVTVLEEEKEVSKPLSQVQKGDRLLLRSDELIPADAILIEGDARIDYSFVTGESEAVQKEAGNQLFAGGRQKGGIIVIELIKDVSQSYLTRLWNEEENPTSAKKLDNITDRLSKVFTYAILVISLLGGGYWYFTSGVADALKVFTAVLIIACPCALALTVPFTLGNAMRLLSRKSIFLKNTEVIEQMAAIDQLVFDKTGTITSNGKHAVNYEGEALSLEEEKALASLVRQSTHPVSKQLFGHLAKEKEAWQEVADFESVTGKGIRGRVGELQISVGKKNFVLASETNQEQKQKFQTEAHISMNGDYKGRYTFRQTFREGMENVIPELKEEYQLSLLSGDNEGERKAIEQLFEQTDRLHFQQSPEGKKDYIRRLQKENQQVMMLGDGLNDAGALLQSEVGVAISEDVNQFSPACDVVLHAEQLQELAVLLHFSKKCMKIVRSGFTLSLMYNLVGVSLALQGLISPLVAAVLMPISSITVVSFGMLMTSWHFRKTFLTKR